MNTREMWENQVELLTRHCRALSEQVDKLEQRVTYYENVLFTLLTALKDAGDRDWETIGILCQTFPINYIIWKFFKCDPK